MFVLDSENQIEKAMQKARKVKPLVKMIAFGVYAVKGSKGDSHTVRCSRNPLGQKQVDCECEGGRKGLVMLSHGCGFRTAHRFSRAKTTGCGINRKGLSKQTP